MRYVVRVGKRRGRGGYLTCSDVPFLPGCRVSNFVFHYTMDQRKALRFETREQAEVAAERVSHVKSRRIVTLRDRQRGRRSRRLRRASR